ncbi:MAG: uncharacterized protein KVP18_003914 [Porospora cf. gigantea A]|uniref:uncharacterized protein n=2 Tax=Porospora cf. gigantea A TaxID=2853593 RepID=UPI00355A79C6|nr:MAG: hypothetical protein KVP18_003914 [Porospora cf. gigantea A]
MHYSTKRSAAALLRPFDNPTETSRVLGDLLLQRDVYTSDVSDTVFPEDYILQQVVAPLVQRLGRKRRRLERLAYESCVQPWTLLRHRYTQCRFPPHVPEFVAASADLRLRSPVPVPLAAQMRCTTALLAELDCVLITLGHDERSLTLDCPTPVRVAFVRHVSNSAVVTAGDDGLLKVWSTQTGRHLFSIRRHLSEISDIDTHKQWIISGDISGEVNLCRLFDVGWEPQRQFRLESSIRLARFLCSRRLDVTNPVGAIMCRDEAISFFLMTTLLAGRTRPDVVDMHSLRGAEIWSFDYMEERPGTFLLAFGLAPDGSTRSRPPGIVFVRLHTGLNGARASWCVEDAASADEAGERNRKYFLSSHFSTVDGFGGREPVFNSESETSGSDTSGGVEFDVRPPPAVFSSDPPATICELDSVADYHAASTDLPHESSPDPVFSNSGSALLTTDDKGSVVLWRAPPNPLLRSHLEMVLPVRVREGRYRKPAQPSSGRPRSRPADGRFTLNSACWSCDDRFVVVSGSIVSVGSTRSAAARDSEVSVFDALSGARRHSMFSSLEKSRHSLKGVVTVLAPHPFAPPVVLCAESTGQVYILDVAEGRVIRHWPSRRVCSWVDGQWHPQGTQFSLTTRNGCVAFFSLPFSWSPFSGTPCVQFLQEEATPLVDEGYGTLVEEGTGRLPHEVPRGLITDSCNEPLPDVLQPWAVGPLEEFRSRPPRVPTDLPRPPMEGRLPLVRFQGGWTPLTALERQGAPRPVMSEDITAFFHPPLLGAVCSRAHPDPRVPLLPPCLNPRRRPPRAEPATRPMTLADHILNGLDLLRNQVALAPYSVRVPAQTINSPAVSRVRTLELFTCDMNLTVTDSKVPRAASRNPVMDPPVACESFLLSQLAANNVEHLDASVVRSVRVLREGRSNEGVWDAMECIAESIGFVGLDIYPRPPEREPSAVLESLRGIASMVEARMDEPVFESSDDTFDEEKSETESSENLVSHYVEDLTCESANESANELRNVEVPCSSVSTATESESLDSEPDRPVVRSRPKRTTAFRRPNHLQPQFDYAAAFPEPVDELRALCEYVATVAINDRRPMRRKAVVGSHKDFERDCVFCPDRVTPPDPLAEALATVVGQDELDALMTNLQVERTRSMLEGQFVGGYWARLGGWMKLGDYQCHHECFLSALISSFNFCTNESGSKSRTDEALLRQEALLSLGVGSSPCQGGWPQDLEQALESYVGHVTGCVISALEDEAGPFVTPCTRCSLPLTSTTCKCGRAFHLPCYRDEWIDYFVYTSDGWTGPGRMHSDSPLHHLLRQVPWTVPFCTRCFHDITSRGDNSHFGRKYAALPPRAEPFCYRFIEGRPWHTKPSMTDSRAWLSHRDPESEPDVVPQVGEVLRFFPEGFVETVTGGLDSDLPHLLPPLEVVRLLLCQPNLLRLAADCLVLETCPCFPDYLPKSNLATHLEVRLLVLPPHPDAHSLVWVSMTPTATGYLYPSRSVQKAEQWFSGQLAALEDEGCVQIVGDTAIRVVSPPTDLSVTIKLENGTSGATVEGLCRKVEKGCVLPLLGSTLPGFKPGHDMEDGYEGLKVRWTDDSNLVDYVHVWEAMEFAEPACGLSVRDREKLTRITEVVIGLPVESCLKSRRRSQRHSNLMFLPFVNPLPFPTRGDDDSLWVKDYWRQIPLPICLMTMLERLQNEYYRRPAAYFADLNLLVTNAIEFNCRDSPMSELAAQLFRLIVALYQDQPTLDCPNQDDLQRLLADDSIRREQVQRATMS